jgi:hypothetical protein
MGSLGGTDSGPVPLGRGSCAFHQEVIIFHAVRIPSDLREQKVFFVFSCGSICLCRSKRSLKYNCFIQFRYLAILFVFPYKRLFRRIY